MRRHLTLVHSCELPQARTASGDVADVVVQLEGDELRKRQAAYRRSHRHRADSAVDQPNLSSSAAVGLPVRPAAQPATLRDFSQGLVVDAEVGRSTSFGPSVGDPLLPSVATPSEVFLPSRPACWV